MFTTRFPHRLKALFRVPGQPVAGRRPAFRPRLEALEDRALPSTITWDGGHPTSSNWSEPLNWHNDVGQDVAPVAGDDLVFPAGAARLTNFNNLPNTRFNSLSFNGSGYTISGGPFNRLDIGAAGICNCTTSVNSYNGPIQLLTQTEFIVAADGKLVLGGVISGSGTNPLVKQGDGTLTLNGVDANTYTGQTAVFGGLLELDKFSNTGPTIAIPGNLRIVSDSTNAEVRLLRANQIADNATVTLTQSTSFTASLNLNSFSDAIGALNMTGGTVDTGAGTLTLNGNVTAQAASGTLSPVLIRGGGALALGSSTRTFTVNKTAGFVGSDLQVLAGISGSILIKEGAGGLTLNNAAFTQVEVNAGALEVDGFLSGNVILRNDALLSGFGGSVTGSVSTQGGAVRTLDDGSPGFTRTGSWTTSTGQGFANDFLSAGGPPLALATANWTFTGVTPGLYRVFATWTGGNSRLSRSAPYSIFDNTTLRATAIIDQERAPTGGLRDGGVLFQQLAGAVNITSGTLKVQLTNQVPSESDLALVLADAVRIERLAGTINPGSFAQPTSRLELGRATLGPGSTYRVDFVSSGPGVNVADQLSSRLSFTTSDTLLVLSSTSFSAPTPGTAFPIILIRNISVVPGRFDNLPNDGDTIELAAGDGQRHTFSINYRAGSGNDVDLIYQNTATQVRDLELLPAVINEGERVTLRGALTDPNRGDVLSLRINWGDGTVQTFTDLGTRPFRFTHTYADNRPDGAPYPVRVEWFDQHGAGNVRKLFVTVNNVPPRLFLSGAEVIRASELMHHTGRFTDPGADTWTATVDYGDGSGVQPLAIQPGQQLLFEHRYARPGTYRVTVTVFDDDGGLGTDTFLVIVLPAL